MIQDCKTTPIIVLIAVYLCLGCTPEPPVSFRIGTNVWPGYEPLYLAQHLGYTPDDEIRMVEYSSATQVLHAFRNNTIQAAAVTLDEALKLKAYDQPLSIILALDTSNGGDVVIAQPEFKALDDLMGARIGVENTALGAFMLTRALDFSTLSTADLEIIPMEFAHHEAAFLESKVDAIVTFEPVRSKLLAKKGRILFDSSQIPDEIIDVLIVHPDAIDKYHDQIISVIRGWFRALHYLETQPRKAASFMTGRLRIPVDDIIESFKGLKLLGRDENLKLLTGTHPPLAQRAATLTIILTEKQLLSGDINLDKLINTRALESATSLAGKRNNR